jgi:hypothetical protein
MSFPAVAKFPGSIWDGSSASRSATIDNEPILQVYRGPNADDYSQITAEVIAMQNAIATNTIHVGAGGLTTSSTAGYGLIPSVAGQPTGVPANVPSGFVAACYDSTNKKINIYDGGWIKTSALS